MYERVAGVVTQQGTDISDLVNREANAHGCPPRLLVACGIGESDLDEQAARPLDPADYPAFWPDVSFGLLQQTVAYAPIGDQTASLANIRAVRAALFDVDQAVQIAAPQLARFWQQYQDGPETLGRYNWPARGLQGNPNRANIERAWAESAQYVMPQEETMADHSFELGFKELAKALGADVVGEPVTDEFQIGDGPDSGVGATLQVTTQGVMVYASGAGARFLASQGV